MLAARFRCMGPLLARSDDRFLASSSQERVAELERSLQNKDIAFQAIGDELTAMSLEYNINGTCQTATCFFFFF